MAEPILVNPQFVHHFALDPRVSPSYMAQVIEEGVLLYPETYFKTGRELIIPANGGQIVAFYAMCPPMIIPYTQVNALYSVT